MQAQDGTYNRRPWTSNTPTVAQPNYNNFEDQRTAEALNSVMTMDPEEIRNIRPPIPINPFPPKFGYRVEALGIADIANLDDIYQRHDFTGSQSGFSGTSYPSLGGYSGG